MASSCCFSSLIRRITLSRPQFKIAAIQSRFLSENAAQYKRRAQMNQAVSTKRKGRTTFKEYDLKEALQFSLCDAMRYIRAFEVGYLEDVPKYDLAVKLRTGRSAPTLKSRLKLPHPVSTSHRVCVICAPESAAAAAAKKAGAVIVGEEDVFKDILAGKIDFDKCVAHIDSADKLKRSNVARILGPRKLMPNVKMGTLVKDVAGAVNEMIGGCDYRERNGVVRMAIGRLGSSPEEVTRNIQHMLVSLKKDIAGLPDGTGKEITEVVLSSTHSPGFSLNGDFRSADSVPTKYLSGPM